MAGLSSKTSALLGVGSGALDSPLSFHSEISLEFGALDLFAVSLPADLSPLTIESASLGLSVVSSCGKGTIDLSLLISQWD